MPPWASLCAKQAAVGMNRMPDVKGTFGMATTELETTAKKVAVPLGGAMMPALPPLPEKGIASVCRVCAVALVK